MTLVVGETGEVVDNPAALAVPEPNSLVAVDEQCATIEAWAESVTSIPLLQDATHKLAAIDEYLSRTSTEGRGRVAAAMRRLEVRIGSLLGPRKQGERSDLSTATDKSDDGLTKDQRSEFRAMAENEEVVEDVIAESTDEAPASRSKVTDAIKEAHTCDDCGKRFDRPVWECSKGHHVAKGIGICKQCFGKLDDETTPKQKRSREPKNPEKTRQGIAAKWAKVAELAAAGQSSRQIAEAVGMDGQNLRRLAKERGIEFPADETALTAGLRKIDANRVVAETVTAVEAAAFALNVVPVDVTQLDRESLDGWVSSLSASLRSLTTLRNNLKKELTQ